MRAWLKGGIIGAGAYLIGLLIAYNCSSALIVEGKDIFCGSDAIFVTPHYLLLNILPVKTAVSIMLQPAALQFFTYLVFSIFTGALIGWFIGNIKMLNDATVRRENTGV